MAVRVKIFGLPETVRSLNRGIRSQTDLSDPLEEIAEDTTDVIKINFSSQGRRGGGSWQFLKKDTIKRRGFSGSILRVSDRLYNSVAIFRGPEQTVHMGARKFTITTSVPYAATHQFGRDKIPARPYVKFVEGDRKRWGNILQDHLIKAMRGV